MNIVLKRVMLDHTGKTRWCEDIESTSWSSSNSHAASSKGGINMDCSS